MCLALPQKTPVSPVLKSILVHIVAKSPPSSALNLLLVHIVAKIPPLPALKSILVHIVAKIPPLPALNLVSGHIVVKIPPSSALNLVLVHIVAKIPPLPALNLVFAHIVAKSLDREDKTKKAGRNALLLCVWMTGLEPATSWSLTRCATNCATSRILDCKCTSFFINYQIIMAVFFTFSSQSK